MYKKLMSWNAARVMYIPGGVSTLKRMFAIEPNISTATMLICATKATPLFGRISGAYNQRIGPNVALNKNTKKMVSTLMNIVSLSLFAMLNKNHWTIPMLAVPKSSKVFLP